MLRGYSKLRLLPTKEQEETFVLWGYKCRAYHNFVLYNQTKFDNRDVQLNMVAAGYSILEARKEHWPKSYLGSCNNDFQENGYNAYQNGTNFFKLPSALALGVLKNLSNAWSKFFDFQKNPSKYPALLSAKMKKQAKGKYVFDFGKPKYFDKNECPNLSFTNGKPKIIGSGKKRHVRIPTLGKVKFITDRDIPENIKQFSVQNICGKWYMSLIVEDGSVAKTIHNTDETIGIDVGIRHFIAKSDETFIDVPDSIKKSIVTATSKIKLLQKKMARQTKGGKNWLKTKELIGKYHNRKANISGDFIHNVSNKLTSDYCEIYRENLKISNMTKSAKGTVEEPGTNVAAKSGLNRSILEQKWGMLFIQLEYKSTAKGGKVIKVDPKNTSRTCPKCGHVEKDNRKDEKFKCKKCLYENHADYVGAINIKNRGLLGDSLLPPVRALGKNSLAHVSCEGANMAEKEDETLT